MPRGKGESQARAERGPSGIAKAYLLFYNGAQFVAWTYLFGLVILYLSKHLTDDKVLKQLFQENVMSPLELFQGISMIEALHAAIGLVKTSPVLVVIQQASRLFVMFGVCEYVPQVWDSYLGMIGIRLFVFCWTLSEVVRYSFYVFATLDADHVPGWSKWLRYNVFLLNYPAGVTGEMTAIVATIQLLRGPLAGVSTYIYQLSIGGQQVTLAYWWFLAALLVPYLPVWWQLYSKLLAQRRRLYSVPKPATKAKKAQ